MGRELPADDPPAVGIDHEAEEHQPLPAAQIREVCEPRLIGPGGREVALHEIRAAPGRRVGPGGTPRLAAALGALQAVLAHQPLHTATPDLLSGA